QDTAHRHAPILSAPSRGPDRSHRAAYALRRCWWSRALRSWRLSPPSARPGRPAGDRCSPRSPRCRHGPGGAASWPPPAGTGTGSVLGGLPLGAAMALAALVVGAADLSTAVILVAAGAGALVAVASDTGAGGFHLPMHTRQVNEDWLDLYRGWVYGVGFGWQIG